MRLNPIVLLLLAGSSETSTRTPDDAAGPDAGTADLHGGREAAWDLPPWDTLPLEGGAPDAGPSIWQPKPGTTWHWQLTKTVDQTVNATMFDIDLFDNTKTTISALKAKGKVVICYFSAGSYESWRPDAKDFPQSVLGSKMSGWDELWLDIRSPAVHQIMKARMDLAVTKGCDGVEPDNVDGHDNATGFPLVPADQLAYNTLLAAEAHKRGLSVGLKNDLSQVAQLLPHFDWALNEQCLNPYQVGVVGSTDTHNGTPGNTREQGWVGHVGSSDDTPEERLGPGNTTHRGLVNNPGGLAAVWSVERSRDAIFEAMRRREVYATSGTRIQVRLFGGWDYPDGLCDDPDLARKGFKGGVPMGGVLPGQRGSGGPRFVVQAQQDQGTAAVPGPPLRQVQMSKGWIDGAGAAHQQVFDVAGDATIGSVDPTTCKTDGKGHSSLCAVWRDPQFDPGQRTFYYARVLEVPTCRWSQWECIAIEPGQRPEGCSNPSVQTTIQERAWTSAVWYEP